MNSNLEAFVAVLKRSGLVDEAVLMKGLSEFKEGPAQTAEDLARFLAQRKIVTDWQAGKLLQGKHKGFFLGKYKLLRLLGKGGMSSVYLAEHVLMRRRCAIKVLPWKFVKDSSYLQRFHREAQAVAALDHPNIVRAYDIDHEKDGNLEINFLVMEYVEGRNLYEVVQVDGLLSPVRAADYIRQGAHGLDHAHEAGMVHRDVKPGNFIVDRNGVVKLMDLGLARVHQEAEDLSLTIEHDERVLGTADYLAPEQAVDSHMVDTRADIYSLGCTFYFLLVGCPPFNEGSLTQRLLAHQTKEPSPVEEHRDDVPEPLLKILRRMMAKDREERVQSAAEVAELLTDWLFEYGGDEWNPPDRQLGSSSGSDRDLSQGGHERRRPAGGEGKLAAQTIAPPTQAESGLDDFLSSLDSRAPVSDSGSGPKKRSESSSQKIREADSSSIKSGPAVRAAPPPRQPTSSKTRIHAAQESPPAPDAEEPRGQPGESSSITRRRGLKPLIKDLKPVPLAVAGVSVLALIAAVCFVVFSGGEGADPAPAPLAGEPAKPIEPVPARLAVEGGIVRVGPEGHFGSLAEAVDFVADRAMSGSGALIQEIRIAAGETLTQRLVVDNSGLGMFPKGLKIIGEGPVFPVLDPPPDRPAIEIDSAEQLTIENLVIQCGGREVGIRLRGYVVGSRLKNLRLKGIERLGISAEGVSGFGSQRFIVENCEFHSKSAGAVGIRFSTSETSDTRQVSIRQCRFLGPKGEGIIFDGTAWGVEVRQTIFHDARQGLVFRGARQDLNDVQIANNTFHRFERGISFESGPTPGAQEVTFLQNLFAGGSGPEAWIARPETAIEELSHGAPTPRYNWSDQAATDLETALDIFANGGRRGVEVEFVSTDPGADAFLKPVSRELRTAVSEPLGPQRFIGAVAP